MKKKRLFSALLAAALTLSLVACGSSEKEAAPAESTPPPAPSGPDDVDLKKLAADYNGEIKLTLWGTNSIGEDISSRGFLLNQMAQDYASQFDNVSIEYVYQGGYDAVSEKVMAGAAAKDLPTMFMTEEDMVKGFGSIAADLNDYVPSTAIKNYSPGLLVSMIDTEGRLLGAPFARSLPVLHANKELLEQAGWKVEDIKTNDDLFACAKDVTDKTGAYGFCAFWDTDAWHWESAIYADGGSVLTEDGSAPAIGADYDYVGAKFVNRIKEGLLAGYVANPYGTPKPNDTRSDMLAKGEVALTLSSSSSISKRGKAMTENGYTLVSAIQPAGEGGYSIASGGSNWVITESSSYEEKMIAGGFLAYLAEDDNVCSMTLNCGNMVITESAKDRDEVKQLLEKEPYYQAVFDSVPYLHARANTPFWTEMYTYAVDKLDQFTIYPAETDVEAMIDDIAVKFQQIIDNNTW